MRASLRSEGSAVSKEETDPFNFEGTFDLFAVKISRSPAFFSQGGIEVMEATVRRGRRFPR